MKHYPKHRNFLSDYVWFIVVVGLVGLVLSVVFGGGS